jgi:SAM-dependent methyltransferase
MKPDFRDILALLQIVPHLRLKKIRSLRGLFKYASDLLEFRKKQSPSGDSFPFGKPYPCLDDWFSESGNAAGYYFHQDLLVARKIFKNNPDVHVDVGSRIDGFVAHVAAFRLIQVIDIRPLSEKIQNVQFVQADMMGTIPDRLMECCDSLSCLHALEHFGLGRYGDPIHLNGHLLGWENLYRLLKRQGKFYFSVPIGPQRIEFNAHRVFSVEYLLNLFADRFKLDCFSFVDDKGNLHENVEMTEEVIAANFGCDYGCGIFELTKL